MPLRSDGGGPDRLAPDLRAMVKKVLFVILREVGVVAEDADRPPLIALNSDKRAARAGDHPAAVQPVSVPGEANVPV